MSHWSDRLAPGDLNACREARKWCATQPSWPEAWAACERADWLLWCLRWTDLGGPWDRRRVPLLLCMAEILDQRPMPYRVRVAAALRTWCAEDSEATRAEVSAASWLAAAVATIVYAAAASDAAASAASAASAAADAAVFAADRHSEHLLMCAIVRRYFPEPPVLGGAS